MEDTINSHRAHSCTTLVSYYHTLTLPCSISPPHGRCCFAFPSITLMPTNSSLKTKTIVYISQASVQRSKYNQIPLPSLVLYCLRLVHNILLLLLRFHADVTIYADNVLKSELVRRRRSEMQSPVLSGLRVGMYAATRFQSRGLLIQSPRSTFEDVASLHSSCIS